MPLSEEQIKQFMDRMLLLIELIYRNTEHIKLDVDKLERRSDGE